MSSRPSLLGQHVVITGASRGIGQALAEAFAARGAVLSLVARTEGALAEVARRTGGAVHACDLADPEAVQSLIPTIEKKQAVDILVNNAAIEVAGPIDQMSAADVARVLQVNLVAPIELCRQALGPMLERRRGHIVNISSMLGSVIFPGLSTYAASKSGLNQFTAAIRAELFGLPIATTLVELGPVPTGMLESVNHYSPVQAAFQRVYKLGLIVDTPREVVASAIVDSVVARRQSLRLPRRAAMFPWLAQLPRVLSALLLRGVPTR